ncbi:coniferrin beta glucosidase [Globomyces pollinis-pini]|nr:coniferrin beta glucosidase [Globomyces pollinis-pini]
MSIAWTRLVPGGFKNSPVNALAIKHYNNVFDLLLRNGITPMVTLYHFDMPAVLETKYKGFLNTDRFTEDYVYFAEQAFSAFGDRIKYWITFNEPITTCTAGYGIGEHAPGYNINPLKGDWSFTPLDLVRCGHTHLVAHAHAVNLYRTKFKSQNGKISMANNLSWGEPMSNDPEDVNATQNFLDANYGWFEDVLNFGDYPQSLKNFISVLLPKFSEEQKKLLKGSTDFIAVNHYTANYIGKWGYKGQGFEDGNPFMRFSRGFFDKNGNRLGNRGAPKWLFNAPWAFEKSLDYITKQYGNRDIYVTENGFSVFEEPWMSVELALKDTARVDYHHHYLAAMQRSISKGSKVKGYMAWTLIDNFEWAAGYTQPFGCTKFDRKTGKRWLKDSAYYLRDYFGLAITK